MIHKYVVSVTNFNAIDILKLNIIFSIYIYISFYIETLNSVDFFTTLTLKTFFHRDY